jgi:hypothetical protein
MISKNKTMAILIALLLTLTITASLATQPANAAVTITYQRAYVGASPVLVGVGQELILVAWPASLPLDIGEQSGAVAGERAAFYNIQLIVTKPDGTNETLTIDKSDPVGGGYVFYTPTAIGTYSVISIFPEVWKNSTVANTQQFYTRAVSTPAYFTVQQDPVEMTWPETPLPTDYWQRPINTANHYWGAICGSWLQSSFNQPWGASGGTTTNMARGVGPESAHILWTKPYYLGGLMDEQFGDIGYETQHYQGISWSGTILNGVVSYTPRDTAHGNPTGLSGWVQLDLYTGEEIYNNNMTSSRPTSGQIYNYESGNQHGGFAYYIRTSGVTLPEIVYVTYVQYNNASYPPTRTAASATVNRTALSLAGTPLSVGTVWELIDGYTRNTICYIANTSATGTAVTGLDGSMTYYNLVNKGTTADPHYYLTVWNSSAGTMVSSQTGTGYWQWRPMGNTFGGSPPYTPSTLSDNIVHDGAMMWTLNVTIPSPYAPRNSVLNETMSIRAVREGEYIILGTAGRNDERGVVPGYWLCLSLKYGEEGTELWRSTLATPPFVSQAENDTASLTGVYPIDENTGTICYESARQVKRWFYDMKTGALIKEGAMEHQFNYYGMTENYYNGLLYSFGYGGCITAYNITTGDVMWIYNATTVGLESAYGGNYPLGIAEICDGKLYTTNGEHSPTQPLMRGPNLRCINATTGEEIWSLLGYWGGMSPTSYNSIMADGIFVGLNYMDMELYAIGKGPSATTVSAPQLAPALGSSVMITGTVTDQTSSGRRNTNDIVQFSLKGTPAISDESMADWMEYLFMQQAKPTNATGVPVTLYAIDPNDNYVSIGETTSDMNGNFGIEYKPEIPGNYHIFASFAGSKSYGPSSASTYLSVGEATPTASPYPEISLPPTEMYIIIGVIAIIIAIAIVGIVMLMAIRRRP